MNTNNEQTTSTNNDGNKNSEDIETSSILKMKDRAGNDLKEEHTETPTESGRVDTDDNNSPNETLGTP